MRERVALARAATPLTPPPVRTAKSEQKTVALRPLQAMVPEPLDTDVEVFVPGKGRVVYSRKDLERLGVSVELSMSADVDENDENAIILHRR